VTRIRTNSAIDLLVLLLAQTPDLSAVQDERLWATIKELAGRYGLGPLVAYAPRAHVTRVERAWCDRPLLQSWARHDRMLGHLKYASGRGDNPARLRLQWLRYQITPGTSYDTLMSEAATALIVRLCKIVIRPLPKASAPPDRSAHREPVSA
jgi:hypothetical protein